MSESIDYESQDMRANDLVERVYQDATKEIDSEALESEEKMENPKTEFESGDHRLSSTTPNQDNEPYN